MENFKDFQELLYYFVFLLIVIFGLGKWIIDLLEVIRELRIKNSRLNHILNIDAKEYNQLQKEFSSVSDLLDKMESKNMELKQLIKNQEVIIKDLLKID